MVHRQRAHVLVGIVGDQLALEDMTVGDDLRRVVDRADSDLGSLEERDVLGLAAGCHEGADDGVERVGIRHAVGIGAETRIADQLLLPDRPQHALGHLLRRGRQTDVVAVTASIGIARRGVGRAAAGARLDLAGQPVVRGLRPHDREQRIEQRQVDHLALAAAHLDIAQADHHRRRPGQSGDAVGEIHRRQDRLAVGKAVDGSEARHAFDQRAEAGPLRIGAGLAPTGNAHDDQLRVDGEQCRGSEAHLLHHAGRKLSTRMAAVGTSRRTRSMARGSRNDRHRLFLLRA